MAEVVLDANVLVGLLYSGDAQHDRARALVDRLEREGHGVVLLDVLVFEAVSVLCRRADERKTTPPDLGRALAVVRAWFDQGLVRPVGRDAERLANEVLDIVIASGGALNANDALIVALHREAAIEALASFDADFDGVPGLQRMA